MHFRSVSDLAATISGSMLAIPSDIDLVVGIPRSGLLAANLIALARNLPLADLDGYLEGRAFVSGISRKTAGITTDTRELPRVLIVDDSVLSGKTIAYVKSRLQEKGLLDRAIFLAVYGTPESRGVIDIQLADVPTPRVFEWNLLHHPLLADACVDIDGVLCRDPTEEENDDGDRYRDFLLNVEPLYQPRHRIGALVSNRLEKFRGETETWMKKHGIIYDKLVLLDLPSKRHRQQNGPYGKFKGETFRKLRHSFFVESSDQQAKEIAFFSGKPCISIESMRMERPDGLTLAQLTVVGRRTSGRIKRRLRAMVSGLRPAMSSTGKVGNPGA